MHRVVAERSDGTYTTAGDANRLDDSSPVARRAIKGLPRLRIPWIGLPLLWWTRGDSLRLGGWVALSIIAATVGGLGPSKRARRSSRAVRRRRRALRQLCAENLIVAALLLTQAPAAASSDVAHRTVNAGNGWAVTARLLQPYNAAVLADLPYFYYPTDESAGRTAADASGDNRTGIYSGSISYRQPGGLPKNPGFAVQLDGNQARLVSGGATVADPTTFSLEMWFKTATTTGGKLIGFKSSQAAFSWPFDRYAFMRTDGRISYGGWGFSPTIITTPMAYNDNVWHHLVVTSRPIAGWSHRQAAIYVDGVSVVSGPTTPTASYSGWWRVGFGLLLIGWPGYPATAGFAGSIENVAVYPSGLSAARIAAHYAADSGRSGIVLSQRSEGPTSEVPLIPCSFERSWTCHIPRQTR